MIGAQRTSFGAPSRRFGTTVTPWLVLRPGRLDYLRAWDLQRELAEAVRAGGAERLILLEHPPTYTLGARARDEHVLASDQALARLGAKVYRVDRGGDVTYHGPGQLVGYPILNLQRRGLGPVAYVRLLEDALIDVLASFGVDAARVEGKPGVWTGGAKIAAIGVRVARGVSMHGFALNVNTDLRYFDYIVPCGIRDAGVTSMAQALGYTVDLDEVTDRVELALAACFGEPVSASPTLAKEAV